MPIADCRAGDGHPLDAHSAVTAPLQPGLDGQGGDQNEPVDAGQRGEQAEEAGRPPALGPRQPHRAEGEGQEQRLGVADVEEVGRREDEKERRRTEADALPEVGGNEAVEQRRHEQRGDRCHQEGRQHRVAHGERDQTGEPREQREEDDVQVEVTGKVLRVAGIRQVARIVRHVAPHRDVGEVRPVPALPRREEVGKRPARDPQRHDADRQDGDLRGQRPGDEEAVVPVAHRRECRGVGGRCRSHLPALDRGHRSLLPFGPSVGAWRSR